MCQLGRNPCAPLRKWCCIKYTLPRFCSGPAADGHMDCAATHCLALLSTSLSFSTPTPCNITCGSVFYYGFTNLWRGHDSKETRGCWTLIMLMINTYPPIHTHLKKKMPHLLVLSFFFFSNPFFTILIIFVMTIIFKSIQCISKLPKLKAFA